MQSDRTRVLKDFKSRKLPILIATDVAARGLDIASVGLVVQAEAPGHSTRTRIVWDGQVERGPSRRSQL
jgi:superfamily II DNA/RNA helicase